MNFLNQRWFIFDRSNKPNIWMMIDGSHNAIIDVPDEQIFVFLTLKCLTLYATKFKRRLQRWIPRTNEIRFTAKLKYKCYFGSLRKSYTWVKLYFVMIEKVDHEFCAQGFDLEIFVLGILWSMKFGLRGFANRIRSILANQRSNSKY